MTSDRKIISVVLLPRAKTDDCCVQPGKKEFDCRVKVQWISLYCSIDIWS